jgi:hypothetical protein
MATARKAPTLCDAPVQFVPSNSDALRLQGGGVLEHRHKPSAACGLCFAFLLLPSGGGRVAGGLP